ncbi:MAG: hypothetical protein U0929_13935 [Planctomycetaceae bacterium]
MHIRWISGLVFALLLARTAIGASFATPNFVAHAADPQVAEQVARTAEYFRKILAEEWTGEVLPNWSTPCPIQVTVGSMGASGSTTFTFENGQVHSWDMRVRGTLERVLDSVVPHEVCHTIFASKFRRPLPRWADEGAATLVEHPSERLRQVDLLNRVFGRRQQMPLQTLFEIREYPSNPEDLYTLYAEGYSLAEFLVQRTGSDGKRVYLDFLADALSGGWEKAVQKHYDYNSVSALEQDWGKWVMAGSPNLPRDAQYALNGTRNPKAQSAKANPQLASKSNPPAKNDVVIRSQSPNMTAPLALISRPLRKTTQTVALEAPAPGASRTNQPTQLRLPTATRATAVAR